MLVRDIFPSLENCKKVKDAVEKDKKEEKINETDNKKSEIVKNKSRAIRSQAVHESSCLFPKKIINFEARTKRKKARRAFM